MKLSPWLLLFALHPALAGCAKSEPTACKAARPNWTTPHALAALEEVHNKVTLDRQGQLFWNGAKVSEPEFADLLRQSSKLTVLPDVWLETEMGVSCRKLESVRDQMETALACRASKPARCVEGLPSYLPVPPGPT